MYVVFSVKGRPDKEKTDIISAQADGFTFCWQDRVIEIEIPDPTRAELQVRDLLCWAVYRPPASKVHMGRL